MDVLPVPDPRCQKKDLCIFLNDTQTVDGIIVGDLSIVLQYRLVVVD